MSQISIAPLRSKSDWEKLHQELDLKQINHAISCMVAHLQALKVESCVIENHYLDQDFTDLYAAFYARVFKLHHKMCRRFHFFRSDLSRVFSGKTASEVFQGLSSEIVRQSYVGFAVIRPVRHAPLGRAILEVPPAPVDHRSELMVRARHQVHLCGVTFEIEGIALTQQDSRVGSCAQATIWMAGRHFHHKHRGPWVSTTAITEAATTLTDMGMARMVPAGSEALHPNNMLQALKAMERQPFVYTADKVDPATKRPIWTQRPVDIIHRYVDSGIPVILGLAPIGSDPVGHAVIVTGATYEKGTGRPLTTVRPTRAEFARYFLINDDQRGANLRLPIQKGSPLAETPHSIEENLLYVIVPLPKKVYLTGELAEELSWDTLQSYARQWPTKVKPELTGVDTTCAEKFVAAIKSNSVVCRTYLTFGWKYKARMLANEVHEDFKADLIYHELPKYVWVTEFGTAESLSSLDLKDHFIYAHCVVDATGSKHWEARSVFHGPGLATRWFHDPKDVYGNYRAVSTLLAADRGYRPKVRGAMDLSPFH